MILAECPKGRTTTFIKTIGSAPFSNVPLRVLHEDDPPQPVTLKCIEKCFSLDECLGFVLYYEASSCHWYGEEAVSAITVEYSDVNQPDVAWFEKICSEEGNN